MKKAFIMIELIYVIVIIGILSAVAIPKFSGTKNSADITKGRAEVSSIRSAIITDRQKFLIRGDNSYISKLCTSTTAEKIFDTNGTSSRKLLAYGIVAGTADGKWSQNGSCESFNYKVNALDIQFDYNNTSGSFTCDRTDANTGDICKKMID